MSINSTRRRFLQGTAVAGGVGALAACGGQQTGEQQASKAAEENSKKAEEQAALPSTAWERADYDAVQEGGTLRIAVSQLPDNWNYNSADGLLADLSTIRSPMGAGAELVLDETGAPKVNPDYVVSAEVTSESPQIVTVKFNPEAKWEDGTAITIADLISEWKAKSGADPAFLVGSTVGYDQVKEIRQTDDEFTGEIEYTTPYADWITLIHPDVPQAVTATPEAFNTGYVSQQTPSKGPFSVQSIDATGGVVTLGRNPNWWGRAPKLETIIYSVVSQTQAPASFANGELDVLDIANGDVLSQAKTRSDASIQTTNGLTWTHLTINTQGAGGALGDVKVREAIARAVNREAVGQAVVGPLEAPIQLVNNYIFMPGQDGYEDSFEANGSAVTYDKAAAEKILDDAGWALNGDVREKDGTKLELAITIPADTKSNSDRASQVMNDLNAIGFKVSLNTVPSDAYFDENIGPKNFDMVTFSWVGTAFPQSSGINIFYPVASEQDYTNLDQDALLKEHAEKMATELDPEERMKASNEFSKVVASGFHVIPFYATPKIIGVKKGLVNYGASQFETADWTQVGYTA